MFLIQVAHLQQQQIGDIGRLLTCRRANRSPRATRVPSSIAHVFARAVGGATPSASLA
jgi:hypothetical protein